MYKVEEFVKLNCPNIYTIIDETPSFWNNVNLNFNKRAKVRDDIIDLEGKFTAETTFFDLIELTNSGKQSPIAMLSLLDNNVLKLVKKLKSNFLSKLKEILKNLLSNFDSTRSNFLDAVGELLMLDFFSNENRFEIIDIEYVLPNGKKVDYYIHEKKHSQHFYVEVYNVNPDHEKILDENDFRLFLEYRVINKRNAKLGDLKNVKLIIVVVVWWFGDIELLASFKKTFQYFLDTLHVQCFALYNQTDNKGLTRFVLKNCLDM